MIENAEQANFDIFRDCLATPLISLAAVRPSKPVKKRKGTGRKNAIKPVESIIEPENDAEELSEFIDVWTVLKIRMQLILKVHSQFNLCLPARGSAIPHLRHLYQ